MEEGNNTQAAVYINILFTFEWNFVPLHTWRTAVLFSDFSSVEASKFNSLFSLCFSAPVFF